MLDWEGVSELEVVALEVTVREDVRVDVGVAVVVGLLVLEELKLLEGEGRGVTPGQMTESTVTRLEQLSESQDLLVTVSKGPSFSIHEDPPPPPEPI